MSEIFFLHSKIKSIIKTRWYAMKKKFIIIAHVCIFMINFTQGGTTKILAQHI